MHQAGETFFQDYRKLEVAVCKDKNILELVERVVLSTLYGGKHYILKTYTEKECKLWKCYLNRR